MDHAGVIEGRYGRGHFIAEGPARLSRKEREAAVSDAARRLWLTASQVGLPPERTEELVAEARAAAATSPTVFNRPPTT